ncbi:CopD family protein [Brachybacterium sp. UMB0905]|uniref:CopD family protein n=1 Tax=Brachybacterium sp. UMB0905 TaxID=2069310 RepID=UPI000C807545|nr:CopD family protein [Brachybacterium sp. UMB0905]PMC76810.1 copper-binding protein [Brachybacterium sp. UMB0905]
MSAGKKRGPGRGALLIAGGVVVLLALIAVIAADAAAAGNLVLLDAGALTRHGAPVAATLADLAAALTLGGAVVAGWMLPRDAERTRVMTAVAIAAGVTTLARGAALAFSYSLATGQSIGSPRFGSDIAVFAATDLGVWLIAGLLIAAATTTVAVLGSSVSVARTVAVLIGLVALASAMTGHAAGDETHEVGTSTMLIHLLAVGIWAGGLAALQLLPGEGRREAAARADASGRRGAVGTSGTAIEQAREAEQVVRRFSHLALICWIALAGSGVWALSVRMNGWEDLLTSVYVQIALAKAVLLILLGVLGALQRRQLATGFTGADGADARSTYRRLAVLELGLMGLAIALGAAMSSSPPPAEAGIPPGGAAGLLTGYPLPAAPELTTVLTAWRPAPVALALGAVLLLTWWRPSAPVRDRSASIRLLLGVAVLVLVTSGPLNVYGKVLVSAHVLQHLLLMVPAGVLNGSVWPVPGRLRELGRRWWIGALLAAAGPILLVTAYAVPLTLRLALDAHVWHLALQALALGAGVLTALAVRAVGAAGAPRHVLLVPAAPLLVGIGAGLWLLLGDVLLAASWFGATGRTWWMDALADQRRAGWAVLAVVVLSAGVAGLVVARLRRAAAASPAPSRPR